MTQHKKVFLLLFVHKKKSSPSIAQREDTKSADAQVAKIKKFMATAKGSSNEHEFPLDGFTIAVVGLAQSNDSVSNENLRAS